MNKIFVQLLLNIVCTCISEPGNIYTEIYLHHVTHAHMYAHMHERMHTHIAQTMVNHQIPSC